MTRGSSDELIARVADPYVSTDDLHRQLADTLASAEIRHKLDLATVRVEAFTTESDRFRARIAALDAAIEAARYVFALSEEGEDVSDAMDMILASATTSATEATK